MGLDVREVGAMRMAILAFAAVSSACGAPVPDTRDDAAASDGGAVTDAAVRDTSTAPLDAAFVDAGPPPADWLSAGWHTSCASHDGRVACWGSLWTSAVEPFPVAIPALARATQLAVSARLACAVTSEGSVLCAGSNRSGQLGVSPDALAERYAFGAVPGVDEAVEVAVGTEFACARRRDGSVFCWGDDALGETGSPIPAHASGSSAPQPTPAPVAGVADAIAIAVGEYSACAVIAGGTVRCWGYDWYGALGRGAGYTGLPQPVAADVEGLTDAVDVVFDTNLGCAVRTDRSVVCWGAILPGLPGFDAASSDHCAVVVDQDCWRAPRPLPGVAGALELSMGNGVGCVRTSDAWQCWGRDDDGRVTGDGSPRGAITAVAVGAAHVCVRDEAGVVACRGRGQEGQLGDGSRMDSRAFVTPILP